MESFVVFASLVAMVVGAGDQGPTSPIVSVSCSDPLQFVADTSNQCWFYQCSPTGLVPKRCALGTHVWYGYTSGKYNPCTERFPIMGMYDCTRNTVSDCNVTALNCKNGGIPQKEGSVCWCNCSLAWQGAPDCSVPTQSTPAIGPTSTCPPVNWCAQALPGGANPCQNGGICINQCVNFVCDCPVPFTKDKFCLGFNCTLAPNSCPAGKTCSRGMNGRDEFYSCI